MFSQQHPPRPPPGSQSGYIWPPGGLISWCMLRSTSGKTPNLLLACSPWESLPSSGVQPPLLRGQRRAFTHQQGQPGAATKSHEQGSSQALLLVPESGTLHQDGPRGDVTASCGGRGSGLPEGPWTQAATQAAAPTSWAAWAPAPEVAASAQEAPAGPEVPTTHPPCQAAEPLAIQGGCRGDSGQPLPPAPPEDKHVTEPQGARSFST